MTLAEVAHAPPIKLLGKISSARACGVQVVSAHIVELRKLVENPWKPIYAKYNQRLRVEFS